MNPARRMLPNAMRHVADLYGAGLSADCGRIRASVLRLTPFTMASNVGSACLVLWSFRGQLGYAHWVWWLLLVGMSLAATLAWWRNRDRDPESASPRTLHRATVHAAVLASIWAVAPLAWFAAAAAPQQMLVGMLLTGMLGAGAYVLSPLPLASLAWIGIFSLAGLGALWQAGSGLLDIALLLVLYALMLAAGSFSASTKHAMALRGQARTERQERMLAVLLHDFEQSAEDALWQTDARGHLLQPSDRLLDMLGMHSQSLVPVPFVTLLKYRGVAELGALRDALNAGSPFRDVLVSIALPERGTRHLAFNGKRLLDEQGHTAGWRGALADVTERVAAQHQLEQLAHADSLTGLANRHTLRSALARALKQGQALALLSLDLDHFKAVNDTLGHTAGDEVLKAVAKRLRGCMRPGDLVARLGGDEFAVLMGHAARPADAEALAQRLIESLSQPIAAEQRKLRVGASVGGVLHEGAADVGVDELLVRADMALYAAKDLGRGRYAVYAPEMGERSRRRVAIEQGLRQAVAAGQLALHWQPKVDIGGWRIVGAEALMRWDHPELGRVAPAEFIVVAEQAGLIDEIGHWALLQACHAGCGPLAGLEVSVNVSPVQLRDANFVSRVRDVLRETGLEPSRLELEITESVFMGDADGMLERLHALRDLGIRVALDDFGTGYSSLAYLRRFPFDTLKIDRAFVSEVLLRKDARAIVQTIAQMAATLGMRTVCEGVESVQQLAAVAEAGCDEVQGYLVSPPRPLQEFGKLHRGWSRERPALSVLH